MVKQATAAHPSMEASISIKGGECIMTNQRLFAKRNKNQWKGMGPKVSVQCRVDFRIQHVRTRIEPHPVTDV
jgi:hypothetical protein